MTTLKRYLKTSLFIFAFMFSVAARCGGGGDEPAGRDDSTNGDIGSYPDNRPDRPPEGNIDRPSEDESGGN
jgi:hypothetical protein